MAAAALAAQHLGGGLPLAAQTRTEVLTAPAPAVAGPELATKPTTFVFPQRDSALQAGLLRVLEESRFRHLARRGQVSVSLVDLSRPGEIRYAGFDDDHMRYAASLAKIAIMLGVFDRVASGELEYTAELRDKLERMIRRSENRVSSELISLIGFEAIERVLRDPHYELYNRQRKGGLWLGRGYGSGIGLWKRDPINNISHGATTRQVARFLVMMDRGELIGPWESAEMKSIMGDPQIHHKFVKGLEESRPRSRIFRKSGTYKNWHADAALVERDGKKYVAVALLDTPAWKGVLPNLIVELDSLITAPKTQQEIEIPAVTTVGR